MRSKSVIRYALILLIPAAALKNDSVANPLIDNLTPRTELLSAFGDPNSAYYAQTFVAPAERLGRLTFELKPIRPFFPVEFRVLLTETAPGPAFHPTTILFESDKQTLPQVGEVFPVLISLGGIQLTTGKTYAFVLDGFTDRDNLNSQVEVGINKGYPGGQLYFLNLSPFDDNSRANHFTRDWDLREVDFTFRIDAVPEPSTLLLLALAGFGLLAIRRR